MPQPPSLPPLPQALRAAVGLAAEAAEQARHLPERAVELPMLAVSTALQLSLRAQQRFAMLAAKGDEILNRRPSTDEPPDWARFDDPPAAGFDGTAPSRFDTVRDTDDDPDGRDDTDTDGDGEHGQHRDSGAGDGR